MSVKNPSVLSSSSWTLGAHFLERGVALIVYIMLARYLDVIEFGVVAFAMLYLEFFAAIINSGMRDFLVTRKTLDSKVINTCLHISIAFSLMAVLLFIPAIDLFFNEFSQLTQDVLYALLLFPIISSYNSIQKAILQRELAFKDLSIRTFISTTIAGVISVYYAYKGLGAWALVIFQYLKLILDTLFIASLVRLIPRIDFSFAHAKESMKFSLPLVFSEGLNFWSSRVMELFVSIYFGPASFAILSVARKFSKLIQQLSLTSLRSVFLSYISKAQDKGLEFTKYTAYVAFFVVPVLVALGVYAEFYVVFVFGQQWSSAVSVIQILAFTSVAHCFTWYFSVLLIANHETKKVFKTNVFFFSMSLIAGVMAFDMSFEHYLLLQVSVINLVSLLKISYLVKYNFVSLNNLKTYFIPVLSAVVFFCVISLLFKLVAIDAVEHSLSVKFILTIVCSVISFCFYMVFTRFVFNDFFSALLSRVKRRN